MLFAVFLVIFTDSIAFCVDYFIKMQALSIMSA